MKILLAIIWLSCSCACTGASEVKKIEELLTQNTKELIDTKLLMSNVNSTNNQIKVGLDQQQVWLGTIKSVDAILVKLSQSLEANSMLVLRALNNITLKSGLNTERLFKELVALTALELSTKQQIVALEQKMDAYQKHVIQNARNIDNNILQLTKLITRAILPKLNGLQCSFDSLETSQINVEVELKSLGRIQDISENTNGRLVILGEQLCSLNRTQNAGLSVLTSAVRQLKPLNSWQLESALRELILSQKRIELDLETCQKRSSPQYSIPDTYKAQPAVTQAQSHSTWSNKQSNHQSKNPGSYHASAYASAPQSKPMPAKPSSPTYDYFNGNPVRTSSGYAVSKQVPLPWDSAVNYQSVPMPGRKRPAPNPKPCTQRNYVPNPQSGLPKSYAHQYQQQGNQPGQPISWYSVSSVDY